MNLPQNSAIEKAIAAQLATGKYSSAEEVVLTALKCLATDDANYQATIGSLQRSLADEAAGRLTPLGDAVEGIRRKHGLRGPEQA